MAPLQDPTSLMPMEDPGSLMTMQGLGPWDPFGGRVGGPFGSHLGPLLFGAHLGPFLFGPHFVPIWALAAIPFWGGYWYIFLQHRLRLLHQQLLPNPLTVCSPTSKDLALLRLFAPRL